MSVTRPALGERKVGQPSVPAGEAPGSLPVSDQVNRLLCVAHDALSVKMMSGKRSELIFLLRHAPGIEERRRYSTTPDSQAHQNATRGLRNQWRLRTVATLPEECHV